MTWVEEHPLKMALIASIICSIGAIIIHIRMNEVHDWAGFFLWLPSVWIIMFAIGGLSAFTLRNRK